MARNDNTNDFVRLKRYALTNTFIKLDETRGIIENISNSLVEISSQPERGKGVVLYPGQTYKIRGVTYAAGEPKEHSSAAIAVEGGAVQESGGGSSGGVSVDISPELNAINATLQSMNTSVSNIKFGCSCNFDSLASEATHERIANALESLAGADFGRGNGLSAYEVALGNGFKGTVQEWLESLKGESYSLPVASDSILGGVKIGSTLTITKGGVLNYNLPIGATSVLGGIKSSSIKGSATIKSDGTLEITPADDWGLLKLDSIGYYVEFNDPDEEEETEAENNE